jgi:hypothetical protein
MDIGKYPSGSPENGDRKKTIPRDFVIEEICL